MMRGPKFSNTKSIRKRVYEYLREKILKGEIPQGERIYEGKLAREMAVSRTPVREALHALEHEGLVISRPRSGYFVKPISKEEVHEICEIRKVIEALALKWAIERKKEKLIRELRKNIRISEKKLEENDIKSFVELDAKFHEKIAELSGSERLLELSRALRRHMLRYRIESIYLRDNVERAIEGHKRILLAMERGSQEEMLEALQSHIDKSREDILRYAF